MIISGAGFFTYSINFIAIEPEFFIFSRGPGVLSFGNKIFYFHGDPRFVARIRLHKPQGEMVLKQTIHSGGDELELIFECM